MWNIININDFLSNFILKFKIMNTIIIELIPSSRFKTLENILKILNVVC
jgi:hypothetical protein